MEHQHQNPEEGSISFPETNMALPAGMEDNTVAALKRRGLIRPISKQRTWTRLAAAAAVAAAIFTTGWLWGHGNIFGEKKQVTASNTAVAAQQQYLLLLYNPPAFVEEEGHAAEYGKWMHSLDNNMVADGAELNKKGWTLNGDNGSMTVDARPISGRYGEASGYFIINAPTQEAALSVATSCPHLKHKGAIELRPLNQ